MHWYYLIYKPFGVVSQFSGEGPTLAALYEFPKEVYPVGRLDKDSEGLLIITNDKHLHHHLTDPKFGHRRIYHVQVEGIPSEAKLQVLMNGVKITLPNKSKYDTLPCRAALISPPTQLPERNPPIRFRRTIPDSWISIELQEGKNRQVRKMTAAIGHPTLRLVRVSIASLALDGMLPGDVMEISKDKIYEALHLT
jgi:23S rRNA pseudouridine2457 synthase